MVIDKQTDKVSYRGAPLLKKYNFQKMNFTYVNYSSGGTNNLLEHYIFDGKRFGILVPCQNETGPKHGNFGENVHFRLFWVLFRYSGYRVVNNDRVTELF